jgi:hypothetical protein
MRFITLLILLAASTLCAHGLETPDSSRFSLELSVGMGNYLGDITDQDGEYYKSVGFGLKDAKGNVQPIDPGGFSLVVDAGGYFTLLPHLAVGPAFKYQYAMENPGLPVKDENGTTMLSAEILLAKVRWEPLGVQNVRLGVEGGVGMGFGTLHRYGLAVEQMDLIYGNLLNQGIPYNTVNNAAMFGKEGNRSLDLLGLNYKLAARMSALLRNGWGMFGTLGFESTRWWVRSEDPLNTGAYKYPSRLSQFGFEFTFGGFKEF